MEVLSPSTEEFDWADKLNDYAQLASLEAYVLISQAEQRVECRRPNASDVGETSIYRVGDRVTLSSLDLECYIMERSRGLDDLKAVDITS